MSVLQRRFAMRLADIDASAAFATIADIESYPAFVPGVKSARIVERRGERWLVENVFAFGPLTRRFLSRAELAPPTGLTIVSHDGPLRNLLMRWSVKQAGAGCAVACDVTLELRSPPLAALARLMLPEVERQVKAAFAARIRARRSGPGFAAGALACG